jgi:hypothetical protein
MPAVEQESGMSEAVYSAVTKNKDYFWREVTVVFFSVVRI